MGDHSRCLRVGVAKPIPDNRIPRVLCLKFPLTRTRPNRLFCIIPARVVADRQPVHIAQERSQYGGGPIGEF